MRTWPENTGSKSHDGVSCNLCCSYFLPLGTNHRLTDPFSLPIKVGYYKPYDRYNYPRMPMFLFPQPLAADGGPEIRNCLFFQRRIALN